MAETEIDPTEGADDEGTVDETSHQTGELALQVNDSVAELPADYYVTLQPLTLDLVATQLERIGINFTREPDRIAADWPTSDLVVRILPDDVLSVRATLRQEYPASGITALTGGCNSWNNSRLFLKASTTVGMSQTEPDDEDGEREPWPVARLCLD